MLVLTRRVGEEIVIDGDIRVTVLMTKGDRVRIGITAPNCVRVDRQEVHERRSEFVAGPGCREGTAVMGRVAKSLGRAALPGLMAATVGRPQGIAGTSEEP